MKLAFALVFFSLDNFVASWDELLKLYFTMRSWEKAVYYSLVLQNIYSFQQEKMVSTSEGRTQVFVARKYLQVSYMMLFARMKIFLDHTQPPLVAISNI